MSYDAIVVGGGHNGLVCAAYLGRAGKRVLVLERRHVLGGCCSTEELWPGFRVSPAAYVLSLFLPEIVQELGLREKGLVVLPRSPSSFTPLPDGRSLVLGPDPAANRNEIARFSERDARRYGEYEAFLTRVAEALEPLLMAPPPALPLRRPRLGELVREAGFWRRAMGALRELGPDRRRAAELLTASATRVLTRWFESEALRATLATDAIIGAFLPPSAPGSAYVLLHHVMGEAGGARGVWAYVRGGMGELAEALGRACRDVGVEIRREAEVVSIDVSHHVPGGAARGVTLADGTSLEADVVASSLDATRTMLGLVGGDRLPEGYARQVEAIDYSSASAKINLALDGLPEFTALGNGTGGIGDARIRDDRAPAGSAYRDEPTAPLRGTIHVAPTLQYIERAYDDAKYGRASREPVLEITLASTVDETLAPPGKHVMSMFVQYAPYELAEGGWTEARKDAFADRCLEVLERYAPGVRGRVLHRQVLAPPDLERIYGLTGGNIFQGALTPSQLGPLRTPYRTPVEGLWLCGAATHPGGGVMGACGRNAAREILGG